MNKEIYAEIGKEIIDFAWKVIIRCAKTEDDKNVLSLYRLAMERGETGQEVADRLNRVFSDFNGDDEKEEQFEIIKAVLKARAEQ